MATAGRWTDAKVSARKLEDGKTDQRVTVDAGLYLRLRAGAGGVTKSWEYRAQVGGMRKWLSLGSYPSMTLAQARAELLKHRAVAEGAKRSGADHPATVARMARAASRAQPTVAEVFNEWLADKRMGSPRKGGLPVRPRTIETLEHSYHGDIHERIGETKIARLTPAAARDCIDAPRRRGKPGAAAHVYRTLRGLVTFAIKRGYIEGVDPMRGIENPKPYRPAPPNVANDNEILSLLRAVEGSRLWPATKLAIEFQLLTGARPTEVRLAVWSEINEGRSEWRLPSERVKSGRAFKVHLSRQALDVLKRARSVSGKSPFVFPGANEEAMEKMAVARALSRMYARTKEEGGKKLAPHDLRRTFRTLLSRLGVPPHIAELCMNHQETETMRRVYDGHDYSAEMSEAWSRAGAHIATLRERGRQASSEASVVEGEVAA
nr:site-specific integrase [Caldimonas tepidiphila]